jgi:hypothetical protein
MRFRVVRANIPDDLRTQFEEFGEMVVAQIMGRPLTHAPEPQNVGVPVWAKDNRKEALAWLREQHHIEDRRRTISECMELAILLFVIAETVTSGIQLVKCSN